MNNNKFNGRIVQRTVSTNKLENGKSIKILTIADLHGYTNNPKLASRLAYAIKLHEPDLIFVAGDIFSGGSPWDNGIKLDSKLDHFYSFIQNISEVAPVCITLGNHDVFGMNDDNEFNRFDSFYRLENARSGKVFPLYRECIDFVFKGQKVEVLGYVPESKLLCENGLHRQFHGHSHDQFIRYLNADKLVRFSNNASSIKLVLGHNPHLYGASENGVGLGPLKVADGIHVGHLHGGYYEMFAFFDKLKKFVTGSGIKTFAFDHGLVEQLTGIVDKNNRFIKGSIKIFGPTDLCRGIVYLDDKSQRKLLQLSDNEFYKNNSIKANNSDWHPITSKLAQKSVLTNHYHYLSISEGITPLFYPSERFAKADIVELTGVKEKVKAKKL